MCLSIRIVQAFPHWVCSSSVCHIWLQLLREQPGKTARSPSSRWHVPNFLCARGFILNQPLAEAQSHSVICTNLSSVTNKNSREDFFWCFLVTPSSSDGWVAQKRYRCRCKQCAVWLFFPLLMQSFYFIYLGPWPTRLWLHLGHISDKQHGAACQPGLSASRKSRLTEAGRDTARAVPTWPH